MRNLHRQRSVRTGNAGQAQESNRRSCRLYALGIALNPILLATRHHHGRQKNLKRNVVITSRVRSGFGPAQAIYCLFKLYF